MVQPQNQGQKEGEVLQDGNEAATGVMGRVGGTSVSRKPLHPAELETSVCILAGAH